MKFILMLAVISMVMLAGTAAQGATHQSRPAVVNTLGPISLNKASAHDLARVLKGVGLKKALAIVSYRKAHGPFRRIEELTAVSGIGPSLLKRNRKVLKL